MSKSAIKETIKTVHKLSIEGTFDVVDNKIIIEIPDSGEKKELSKLAIGFVGEYVKIAIAQDSEEDVPEVEQDEDKDE